MKTIFLIILAGLLLMVSSISIYTLNYYVNEDPAQNNGKYNYGIILSNIFMIILCLVAFIFVLREIFKGDHESKSVKETICEKLCDKPCDSPDYRHDDRYHVKSVTVSNPFMEDGKTNYKPGKKNVLIVELSDEKPKQENVFQSLFGDFTKAANTKLADSDKKGQMSTTGKTICNDTTCYTK